ncbi:MAG TPA: hypothetical protein VHF22_00750 [Planctomycetota bacterium]|nr:hypothetical protein [Planctomycetota bacterium]
MRAIPLVVVLAPDGHEIKRQMGYMSPDELIAFLGAPPAAPGSSATPAAAPAAPAPR